MTINISRRGIMRLPVVTKECLPLILIVALCAWLVFYIGYKWLPLSKEWIATAFILICFVLMLAILFFFRDPERKVPDAPESLICPADGVVLSADQTFEPEYINGNAKRVSIFMNVLNMHVQRSPVSGTVEFCKDIKGKYISAFKPDASQKNKQRLTGIRFNNRKILVKQIAGLLARTILSWKKEGDVLKAGERIGMIVLGSRVELYFPLDAEVLVKENDKVRAGETVVAKLNLKRG